MAAVWLSSGVLLASALTALVGNWPISSGDLVGPGMLLAYSVMRRVSCLFVHESWMVCPRSLRPSGRLRLLVLAATRASDHRLERLMSTKQLVSSASAPTSCYAEITFSRLQLWRILAVHPRVEDCLRIFSCCLAASSLHWCTCFLA